MPLNRARPKCVRGPGVVDTGKIAGWGRAGILIFLVLAGSLARAANPVITLDGAGTGRMFEGAGAMSAGASSRLLIDYPEPYRSQILDYLFKPNYGASFQDLKIELGGDMNSTTGSEPSHMHSASDQNYSRGFEWWLMEQAKQRNPNITLGILAWGAPGWIGNGQFFSQDAINYIVNFIQGAKTYHNLTIDYVGILDERPYDIYWIIQLKAALRAQGLTTKIVAADESSGKIIEDVLANPALMDAVDVLGFHYPRWDGGPISVDKPIWASEDGQAWTWNGNWPGAAYLAKAYIRPYINSRITRHQVWSLVTSYYDMLMFPGSGQMYANTPWSGNYLVQPAIWATAHTNQFAGPGWQYIDSSCGFLGSGSFVTIRKGSDFSLIIENVDGTDTPVTFNIVNGLSAGALHVWKSDQTAQFVQQADIIPVNGSFSFTVAAGSIYSITTTTGQAKGTAAPPPAAPFPFPYADDFENYPLSAQAKYFFDLNGSFEIVNCAGGRTGLCLRQAAPSPPIPWTTIGSIEPSNVLGSTNWDNYQVSADVFFEQPGTVKLMGRISGLDVNNGNMYGYQLYVDQLGNWSLRQGNFVSLANGSVPFGAGAWHALKLLFSGGAIQVVIDGVAVANLATNDTYARGMVGLGVQSWTTAQFDNFRIDPLPGAGTPVSQSQVTATATGETPGYEAAKAVDGDSRTFWNSPFTCIGGCRATQPLPQSLTLALGSTYSVERVRYAPRQDNNLSGTITSYNVYLSSDGTNFTKVTAGNWAADATEKSASFAPTSASYVRLEAVSTVGGTAAASEVNVDYDPGGGTANPAPAVGSLIPSLATAGDAGFVLSVNGSNFIVGSVVRWNGTERPTSFVNSTVLSAVIPSADLTSVGNAVVTVVNPAPGGGVSGGQTFTINPPGGTGGGPAPGAPFVSGYASGPPALRNDFSGWVGMKLTVGSTALNVSSLGRICVAGNTGTHTVKLVNAGTRQDVASAQVNMAGCTGGQFVYTALSANVSLAANASYYLATQETAGGDRWYDAGTVPTTPDAVVNNAAYSVDGTNFIANSNNASYVPPNLQYSTSTAPPISITVTVQGNLAGAAFLVDGTSYSSTQVLTWTSGSTHTIAAATPQNAGAGTQYVWTGWSDGGGISHNVAPASAATYTVNFAAQYLLTTNVSPAASGTILANPSSSTGYYNSGTSVQLSATASTGYTFANWSGDATGSTSPQTISMTAPRTVTANFQPASSGGGGGGASTAFVTAFSSSGRSLRDDFSGWVGMQLTVGATPMNVSALGRACIAGNSAIHTVKLVNAATRQDVASAQVNMAACEAGQFVYVALPGSVTLPAGGNYFLATQEAAGGDRWYEFGPISTTTDASVNSSVYSVDGASWIPINSAYTSYVPPNLQYSTSTTTPASITVTVQTNLPGSFFLVDGTAYSSMQVFNWPSGSPHTIGVTTPQSAGSGTQYVWTGWSDGGASSHTVAPTSATTYTASFVTQYLLTSGVSPTSSGTVSASPASATGYYASGTPVQLTAIVVGGNTFLNWSGDASGNTNPLTITMTGPRAVTANYQPPTGGGGGDGGGGGGTGSPFLTSAPPNGRAVRNDFSGWVGMKLTIGSAALSVNSLGRICIAGNALTHTVKLVNAGTKLDVATAPVSMAGCAAGQYVYTALAGTVTLPAGTSYYLVSQETAGADQWYDFGAVTPAQDAAVNSSVYSIDGATWIGINGPNTSYVPPNFQYVAAPPDPSSPFVTAYALSSPSLRNDFSGWVGMKLTIGASSVNASSLGRICATGNSGTHTVKFVSASTGQDVAGGSVAVNMSGCTTGQFSYNNLANPITLQAGASYYLVTQETAGGDRWYDFGDVATASFASVNQAVYGTGTSWFPIGSPRTSYGPPNFK